MRDSWRGLLLRSYLPVADVRETASDEARPMNLIARNPYKIVFSTGLRISEPLNYAQYAITLSFGQS
jgi:hypothetical protein